MPFNLAEARLSTIKELQKQLKKWKKYCGKAEDRLDKQMKLNEDLQEEIKKLKEVKYPVTFQKTYKIQQEQIKELKQFKSEVIEAMKYDDDLDDEDIIKGIRDMEEDIVGESELKEEAATNQRRATMYQFMSEYMEEADCMGEYFDYIRENYPEEQKAAGVLSD